MDYQTLRIARHGGFWRIVLDRPEAGNRLNARMAQEIAAACDEVRDDPEVRVVVLQGGGDTFCAGLEMTEIDTGRPAAPLVGDQGLSPAAAATAALAALECVLIAAIAGECQSAGLDLALACDLRIATEDAVFGYPEVLWGTLPEGGGTQRLPRIVGRGKALEMLLTGESIGAAEAFRTGLVNRVVPREQLEAALQETVDVLLSRGPIALRYAKEAVLRGSEMTIEQGLRLEGDLNFLLQTTEDRAEGVRAWIERRAPRFQGR